MLRKLSWTLWPPPRSPVTCTEIEGYFGPVSGSFSHDLLLNTLDVGAHGWTEWWGPLGITRMAKAGEIPVHWEGPVGPKLLSGEHGGTACTEFLAQRPLEGRLQVGPEERLLLLSSLLVNVHLLFHVEFEALLIEILLRNLCSNPAGFWW